MSTLASDASRGALSGYAPSGELTIGQVSRLSGVAARTIRYYESVGLLPRPPREANNYRRYTMADVKRLRLLSHIRALGVPLSTARPLLAEADDARCAEVQDALLALVRDRLRALAQEIAELQQIQREVEAYERALRGCRPDERASFRECSDMAWLAFPQKECPCDEACCA
jgi:DNA-binding transcriptional MerR regulator